MADSLTPVLEALHPLAVEMSSHLQGPLTQAASLQKFSQEASRRAHQNADLLHQQSEAIGKRFSGFDALMTSQRDRVAGKLAHSASQLSDLKSLLAQHALELEQEHNLNAQSTTHLMERITRFTQSVKTSADEQQSVMNQGMQSVRTAEQSLVEAHTAVHNLITATSIASVAAAKAAEASLEALRLGLLKTTGSCQSSSEAFSNRSKAASTKLHTQVEQVHKQTVQPSVILRSNQYQGAVYRLQADSTAATTAVDSALSKHAAAGTTASQTLASNYTTNTRHVLSSLPVTNNELAKQATHVQKVADSLSHQPPPPAQDNRNWFQKGMDAVVGGVKAAVNFIGAAFTNTGHFIIDHAYEIGVGVAVAAATAGAIIFSGGTAIPIIVAAVGVGSVMGTASAMAFHDMHFDSGALAYESSRLIHYLGTPAGIFNTTIDIVAGVTGLWPLHLLTLIPVVSQMVHPAQLDLPDSYTTGQSVAQLTDALQLAKLTKRIYWDDGVTDMPDGGKWNGQLADSDIPGYTRLEVITNDDNALKAEVWQKPDGTIALVYRGTQGGKNALEDVAQGLGIEASLPNSIYMEAVNVARGVQARYPNSKIELVGDSLGGGLAHMASAATGLHAVTFNAAAVNPVTYAAIGKKREDVVGTNYTVAGQILDTFQSGLANNTVATSLGLGLTPIAAIASDSQVAGTTVQLAARNADGSKSTGSSIDRHLWDVVGNSLKAELKKAEVREAPPPPATPTKP